MPKGREGEMGGRRVLGIGLDPYTIDFDSEFFQGKPLNANIIASGIKADEDRIRGMGHDFAWLLIDARRGPEEASAAARAALSARRVDVVVIGGGVRLDPAQTRVLEALVNAVIEAAPGARIGFNTSPTDTAEVIGRV
jgi:hypothetical protein